MEEQAQDRRPTKSVYTVLAEISEQLKLIREVVYNSSEEDSMTSKQMSRFLGVHNVLQDIDMKVCQLLHNDELDQMKAPEQLQIW